MSNGVSSSSSFSTSVTGGFKGVTTSSTMIEFSPTSTKTKKITGTTWYLCSKGVEAFYLTN